MYPKRNVVAMLLAGGQGSRLGLLTKKIAKPAIPFGGKYRIIDFPLSNCTNSGISAVGVLTQYQPLVLNDYIGSGQPWDLDNMHCGVHLLSPYRGLNGENWYTGTANAIYQNIHFIKKYDPDYVVILSGDHIYKMDYSKMIEYHKRKGAACTIAVIDVPMEEAHRFGILNTNDDGSIYEFEEKPKNPKSTKASMGIYVFSSDKLYQYLNKDAQTPESDNDFGKNVLPDMLNSGEKMFAYEFSGYWKDVGTIDSLWEANMDLLDPNVTLDLREKDNQIYSRNPVYPPHYVDDKAEIQNSIIADGCRVYGKLEFSVLFGGVEVSKDALITDSIIMPGVKIGKGSVVQYSIISENTVIGENCIIGERPENVDNKDNWGITVVGEDITIGDGVVVPAKSSVEYDIKKEDAI